LPTRLFSQSQLTSTHTPSSRVVGRFSSFWATKTYSRRSLSLGMTGWRSFIRTFVVLHQTFEEELHMLKLGISLICRGSALTFRFVQYFPEKVKCWITCALGPSRLVLSSYTHMGLFLVSSVTDQDETNPSIHRLCVPPSRPGQPGESTPDFEKMVHERLPHLGYLILILSCIDP
jgi:hypothetical protein